MKPKFLQAFLGLVLLFWAGYAQAANPVVTGTWTGTLYFCTQTGTSGALSAASVSYSPPASVPMTIVFKSQYAFPLTSASNALVTGALSYKMPGAPSFVYQPITGIVEGTTFRATSDTATIFGTLTNFVSPYYRRINVSVLCPSDGRNAIEQQAMTGFANRK